jgi:hypothetical protein
MISLCLSGAHNQEITVSEHISAYFLTVEKTYRSLELEGNLRDHLAEHPKLQVEKQNP